MRSPLIGAIFLSIGMSLCGQPSPEPLSFPRPPALPSRRGLPPANPHQSLAPRQEALQKWLSGLSPEQKAAWLKALGVNNFEGSRRIDSRSLPAAERGYDWRASALLAGLNEAELTRLGQDKVLLENVALAQSFEAYTMPANPVFITSDSILNAFHILFEDSFRQLEVHRSAKLRQYLERLLTRMHDTVSNAQNTIDRIELAPGLRQAQLAIGPALRILGSDLDGFDPDLREEINRQVSKIRAADTVELPAWLGPPTQGLVAIDYHDCRPIGFYAENQTLGNYYRAVRWLQLIPFRAERDAELTAIGLLSTALWRDYESGAKRFFNEYAQILGRPDDPGLEDAGYELQNFLFAGDATPWTQKLNDKRLWLLRDLIKGETTEWAKLRNTHQLPQGGEQALARIQFRILPAYRLPDSLALQDMGEPGSLPPGLVVAALLGSDFAQQRLKGTTSSGRLTTALKTAGEAWHPPRDSQRRHETPSLYDRYLDVLSALTAAPEPEAPAFMHSEVWAAKSCQTVMTGWAQMRHTFTLQAKEAKNYLGLVDTPPGFVEPNPEFFYRLSELIERTAQLLENGEAFQPSAIEEAENLRAAADMIEQTGFHRENGSLKNVETLSPEQLDQYAAAMNTVQTVMDGEHLAPPDDASDAQFRTFHLKLLAAVRAYADGYLNGRRPLPTGSSDARDRWDTLKSVAHRLESLAHKQLRHQPWSKAEADFIRSYGKKLALVSGYFGNSWLTPRDDSPRWTTVAGDPTTGTRLAVAVGRAHLIHVLYPWQGTEIFCTGSVMSYYEYPAKKLLTDEEWKSLLDSATAPTAPTWITPYIAR